MPIVLKDKKTGKMIKPGMKAPPKKKRGGAALQRKKPVSMLKDGGSMKPVPKGNKGLAKLPTDVRNKMGFMSKGGSLKIKSGDTLSQIAKKQGTTVKAIVAANPSITNANMIKVGQTIKIPSNTRTTNPYKGMTSKEITSGKMATRKRKPAPKRAAKKANPKQPIKKSVFGNIKKMLGMKKAGGTVRK